MALFPAYSTNGIDWRPLMKMSRRRSKQTRYNPNRANALRDDLAKHPNPMFGDMLQDTRMTDGDVIDFALTMAHSYFSGTLLESFKTTERGKPGIGDPPDVVSHCVPVRHDGNL